MQWKNAVTDVFGIEYPIVQAPMLGVTTPEMVAAISNGGALGSLPVGGLPPDKTGELIRKTRTLTGKPFAVNLFTYEYHEATTAGIDEMQAFLRSFCQDKNIPYNIKENYSFPSYSYKDQVKVLLEENVSIVSFTFGIPDDESLHLMKSKGVILVGTATSGEEAKVLESKGIDVVVAQGIEAGGHRGSFLAGEVLPMVGTMALVPQIAKIVNLPVLAAGGITSGNTIKGAFSLRASGVQVGTAFIPSVESATSAFHKQRTLDARETDTVLTRALSGRWARGFSTLLIRTIENSGLEIPGYPVQLDLAAQIRAYGQQQHNVDLVPLWAGQGGAAAKEILSAAAILDLLIQQTEAIE